jgi:hypothetical protein
MNCKKPAALSAGFSIVILQFFSYSLTILLFSLLQPDIRCKEDGMAAHLPRFPGIFPSED